MAKTNVYMSNGLTSLFHHLICCDPLVLNKLGRLARTTMQRSAPSSFLLYNKTLAIYSKIDQNEYRRTRQNRNGMHLKALKPSA